MRVVLRFIFLVAVLAAPAAAIGQTRGGDRFIGQAQSFSSGAGLVLAIAVQRN